ncbi:MAG: DNA polymerase III subunit gamma/tau [Candidatus Anoxychlamydiales bacterium]|nr:DNA polymerase III subunit gamma/tau [Candidatus Anoxychlamydiales bacterium]
MKFDDLIGNNDVKQKLKKAIDSNIISNTLLFSGPEGIGKTHFAKVLASSLMHPELDIDPSALRKIEENNHPDLHILEPEGKTSHHSIASIRSLIEQVFMAPFEAEAKIFIIIDADRMLIPSANALLKTLEEPTLDSYIILISSRADEILPTIISRCFKVNFNPIQDQDLIAFLQNKFALSIDDAKKITKIAGGSIGKAIEIATHPDYLKKRDLFISILAKENISCFYELSEAIAKLEDIYVQSFSKENPTKFHKEIDLLLDKLLYWFRDLHLLKSNADEKFLFFSDKIDLLKKQNLNNLISLDKIIFLVDEIKQALLRNIKLKHALENFFIKINFV